MDPEVCPFKMLVGREDNLFERMHGLPKETKEQAAARKEKYAQNVSFVEFLPNSVLRSPMRKIHSNTVKTQQLELYHMDKKMPVELIPNANKTMVEFPSLIEIQTSLMSQKKMNENPSTLESPLRTQFTRHNTQFMNSEFCES